MSPKEAALRKKATLPRRQYTEEQIVGLRALLNPPKNTAQPQRKAA